MEKETIEPFAIIGIAVRACNMDGTAATAIPALWERFRTEDLAAKIPGIQSHDVYSVYTEYEGDYTHPYTTVIGYRVDHLEQVPEGLKGILIPGGTYVKKTVTGNLLEGVVFNAWLDIWNSDLPRAYTADYEVYGVDSANPENATVPIYLAIA